MTREPVNSTAIVSVGYDPGALVLEVEFHSGSVYQYFDVPERVHGELMAADSQGAYFVEQVRDAYRCARVG